MHNNLWLSTHDIHQINKKKKIVFWGNGTWVEKTIQLLELTPHYIIDNNTNIQGHIQNGVEIISFDQLENIDDYFIVITSGSFMELTKSFNSLNLIAGTHYTCSPALQQLKLKSDILNLNQTIVFTVPDKHNGGIYEYNTYTKKYTLLFKSQARDITQSKNYIAMADEENGIFLFSKDFKLIKNIPTLDNALLHGVVISEKLQKIIVVNSARDSLSIFSLETYEHLQEVPFSNKYAQCNEAQHNLNDLYLDEESGILYVCMFSFSGSWRKGIYDGGVIEYDLINDVFKEKIITDLWMPHTICFHNNEFLILDSMRGNFYKTTNYITGNFNGFIRGLTWDKQFYYVAQSSHRHYNRLSNHSLNISLNCGIYVFDEKSKVTYFHSLPEFDNIHNLLIVDEE